MKTLIPLLAAAGLSLSGAATAGDDPVAGAWKVNGHVDGKDFVVSCHFERHGDGLAGACFDGGTNLKHALTAGAASGDQIKWTYVSHFGLIPFNVDYAGKLAGGSMHGTVGTVGHVGSFTATKE